MTYHRSDDDEKTQIVRNFPNWGVITFLVILLGQVMVFYAGLTKSADATQQNTIELKALTTAINAMQISNAGRDAKTVELERRIMVLEQRR